MAKNIAIFGRRELETHLPIVTGVTASVPRYQVADTGGHKEWVVDVFLGILDETNLNVLRDVPVAPYAKQLVTDIRQPIELYRSKQGKYTVVGRAKILASGTQTPEGSILEPTYHEIEYNLTALGVQFTADLDYTHEAWGVKTWGDAGKVWQEITAKDAFGHQVVGVGGFDVFALAPDQDTTTVHTVLTKRTWGPAGSPDALRWGTDPWGADLQKLITLET